jgi:hypothetical protein
MSPVNTVVYLTLGVVCVAYGVAALIRHTASVGLGRPPLFTLKMKGPTATILGLFLIAGGGLIAFPSISEIVSGKALSPDSLLSWVQGLGIAIMIIGLVFSFIIQFAVSLGEDIRKRRENASERENNNDKP